MLASIIISILDKIPYFYFVSLLIFFHLNQSLAICVCPCLNGLRMGALRLVFPQGKEGGGNHAAVSTLARRSMNKDQGSIITFKESRAFSTRANPSDALARGSRWVIISSTTTFLDLINSIASVISKGEPA